jgi:hypothetical protein
MKEDRLIYKIYRQRREDFIEVSSRFGSRASVGKRENRGGGGGDEKE